MVEVCNLDPMHLPFITKQMNGHKIVNQNALHFMTFTVVGWIDIFTRQAYKEIIIESMKYCMKEKGLSLYGYVIMSNHLHVIMSAQEDYLLSDIVRDFKKYTSKKIIDNIKSSHEESRREWMLKLFKYYAKYNKNNTLYQFWRRDNRPTELTSPKWINQKLAYIHLNPVRSGLVDKSEDYIYCSARNYLGIDGLLEIELLDLNNTQGYIDL